MRSGKKVTSQNDVFSQGSIFQKGLSQGFLGKTTVVPGCVKVDEFENGVHLAVGVCVYECIFLSLLG